MSLGNKVAQSPLRPAIDELIIQGLSAKKIARHLFETGAEDTFSEKTIADYRTNFFRTQDSPLLAVAKVASDLVANDPPPTTKGEMLASHFTFNSTKDDLDMIYERIAALRILAKANPDDDQYDKRLLSCLDSAEKIRARVFKFQYEEVRRAILITVGKKICMAAVSIFLPYIPKEKREEAVSRFESAVTPMLGMRDLPEDPGAEEAEAEIVTEMPSNAKTVTTTLDAQPAATSNTARIQTVSTAPPAPTAGDSLLDDEFFMSEGENGEAGS